MTREQAEALGRRALAAGFGTPARTLCGGHGNTFHDGSGCWPDFRDAATEGVLIGQLRDRWGTISISWGALEHRWMVQPERHKGFKGHSRLHTLVAALESAPS